MKIYIYIFFSLVKSEQPDWLFFMDNVFFSRTVIIEMLLSVMISKLIRKKTIDDHEDNSSDSNNMHETNQAF